MTKELALNTTLSHYRIVSKIGEGGMGEVWLAEDTRLGRKVALKLLPAEFTEDSERVRRFTQEAKAASALNHPNIISVYDIGECDTGRFIVMEFVDGRTLRSVIAKDNSLETLFTLGAQMARALRAAHAAGITHRDIKPDNIMVRDDGYVKMLDFGLARLLPTTASDPEAMTLAQQTTPGTVMGTLAYMSPEQASGKTAGSASDVFALGIVLYELATGSHPFKSETMIGYLHAITSQTPPSITSLKSHLPAALDDLILRMLDKNAHGRPTASEIVQALQEIEKYGSSNTLPLRRVAEKPKATRGDEGFRVAVLPFKVRDEDSAVAVLADGLSDEIVTGLSRFRYLSVVTSTSAARLKGETEDEGSLAANRSTRYALEGSIRKGGSAIRVSVQLVDIETGAQLWSETYNRDLQTSTIFEVQDDVAGRIVATVADSYGVLVHSMRAAIRKKDDADLTPVEWQFQYFAYREQITPSAHAALKSRLLRVAERNDGQSDLWASLAQIYVDEYAFGFQGDATSLDRALAAGRRGVELDRANQFALVALAQVHFFRQDLAAFAPAAERGMALNPLNTDAIGILGLQIVHTGQFERGTAIVRRAMELNPNHAGWMHFAPLWDHFHKGEYEQALECANRVDVPGLFWPYLVMASACGHLGRRAEAEAAVKDLLALDPEFGAHVRSNVESWHFASGLMDPLLEGLRKAGLEISDEEPASTSSSPARASNVTRADEGFWVAVLPFKYSGMAKALKALAEGLSEDIVTGLSRFSYLRVIARGSTLRYANQTSDLRTVGKELGAHYVMEGTLRQAGTKLRLAVQLVDATTGAHLWAENYEREFSPENIFGLQDDLVPRIVSTVADWYGVLPHSMSEIVRLKPPDQLSPYEALLRSFGYFENIAPEEHAIVRSSLERAVEQEPGNADGWAMLSMICGEEHRFGFNVEPDSLGRSLEAARRAVSIAHSNHFAWLALAQALFFRKEFDPFLDAAERAIALNPMDGSTVEYLGHLIAFSGNWERGCELAERARQLNPNHPSWYWAVPFLDAYRKGDYVSARGFLLKGNPQKNYLMHALLAAVQGQLGENEEAARHLRKVLEMMPNFPLIGRSEFSKWYLPDLVDHLMDGLRKAGLETADESQLSKSSSSLVSNATRADEGFWVAVLPFKFTGSNTEVATLAEGLSEEIVTGLSRFSYLRVISRSSTLRYANETDDVRTVGKTLGARYVMEGSLRVAGSSLRISVQLIDAGTGAHLWAETYDRQFRAEEVFALQDDLVPRIVSTVADVNGVLPRSMSEVVCSKNPDELSPYEAVLRSFRYFDRVSPDELTAARSCLEIAVEKAPSNADAWAMLALLFHQDYGQGFNLHPDALNLGVMAAQRAVESGPSNHLAYFSLAQARFFQKDIQSFRNAAERAVALNPMDANSLAFMGELLTYVGDSERGLALATRAKEINPNHPGWFWYADYFHAYRLGDYRSALSLVLKANLPGHWGMHAGIAAAAGQLGDHETAGKAIRDLLKLRPDYGASIHNTLAKWFDPELCEQLLDGLRKAGLEIGDEGTESRGDAATDSVSPRVIRGR
jgi:TolB-like protein/Flp pilus assembly protein TadD/predicted Ser/Thr protein kinase